MRALVLLIAFLIGLGTPARAADDVAAAQSVIRSQEQAFSRDDSAAAYSHAAPAIQSIFPDAETFMAMVRNSYAPVYRHKSFELARRAPRTARSRSAFTSSTLIGCRGRRCIHWSCRRTAV
jgi:hypothetical protein